MSRPPQDSEAWLLLDWYDHNRDETRLPDLTFRHLLRWVSLHRREHHEGAAAVTVLVRSVLEIAWLRWACGLNTTSRELDDLYDRALAALTGEDLSERWLDITGFMVAFAITDQVGEQGARVYWELVGSTTSTEAAWATLAALRPPG